MGILEIASSAKFPRQMAILGDFGSFQIHWLLKTLKYAIFGRKSPIIAHETAEITENRNLVNFALDKIFKIPI